MGTRIVLHESRPENPVPGDAWYEEFDYEAESIAEQHRGKRPLRVQLNEHTSFMIYSRAYNKEQGWHGNGWAVEGSVEAGSLTLQPSVNMSPGSPDGWHGWIRKGELVSV